MKMCRNEYESYHIYKALARSPMVGPRFKQILESAAEDELRHYMFLRDVVGECRSRVSTAKVLLYKLVLHLFGLTITLKLLESKELDASRVYQTVAKSRPDLGEDIKKFIRDEEKHEEELLSGINENRIKYIGSIVLGISDAIIELTGIYAGSLGAFEKTVNAGLTGLLAGVAASISMGIASYSQAKHEGRLNPRLSALYTLLSYLAVVILLAIPYFVINTLPLAFMSMITIAIGVIAYVSFYTSVLRRKNYLAELAESTLLMLGVSFLLYILGQLLGDMLRIKVAD